MLKYQFCNKIKMSKEEEEINCLNCDFCYKLLVEPVRLPCGNTICESHLQGLSYNENVIECMLCYENHILPENASKRIKLEIIDSYFNQVVSECKKRISKILYSIEFYRILFPYNSISWNSINE